MVIAASREKGRLIVEALSDLEPKDSMPKRQRSFEISHFQVDMTDASFGVKRRSAHSLNV